MKILTFASLAGLLLLAQPAGAIDGCHSADFNGDDMVGGADLEQLRKAPEGAAHDRFDLDGSGALDAPDELILQNYCLVQVPCPTCPADLNSDRHVDEDDWNEWHNFTDRDCRSDLDRDGEIDAQDEELLNAYAAPGTPWTAASERADLDGDGDVDGNDGTLLSQSLGRDCRRDLNRDGEIGSADLQILLAAWGACPVVEPQPEDPCDKGRGVSG